MSLGDKLKESLTQYIDEKFESYRGQIASDLSTGIASLAGIIAIWSLFIVCLIFLFASIAILLGWFLKAWMGTFAYIISFLFVSFLLLILSGYILLNRKKIIENPVFKIISKTLRNPEADKN